MRSRMHSALTGIAYKHGLLSNLPYTTRDLITRLESTFSEGMTLENYGEWHIDHIKPCCLFDMSKNSEFNECWALCNLQALWAKDNLKKGSKHGGM